MATVAELLPKVRRIVLRERANGTVTIPLSWLTWQLGQTRNTTSRTDRSRFTSGGLKSVRGHAQKCLSILAHEGIMFGRRRPEACACYEHGEKDKRFLIRVTPAQASRLLSKMNP